MAFIISAVSISLIQVRIICCAWFNILGLHSVQIWYDLRLKFIISSFMCVQVLEKNLKTWILVYFPQQILQKSCSIYWLNSIFFLDLNPCYFLYHVKLTLWTVLLDNDTAFWTWIYVCRRHVYRTHKMDFFLHVFHIFSGYFTGLCMTDWTMVCYFSS